MTPERLRQIVVLTGDRLDLQVAALEVPGLVAELGEVFTLTSAERTETAGGVRVTGTGEGGPFHGLAVTADFAVDGPTITGTGDERWSFSDGYPQLKGTIFDTLSFQAPTLRLAPDTPGVTFTGTLVITTHTAPLDLLMPGVTHTITGEIHMVTEVPDTDLTWTPVPDVLLYGPEGAEVDLGLFRLTGLRYEILADPVVNYATGDFDTEATVVLTGTLPFEAGGAEHSVLINAEIVNWAESLMFITDLSDVGQVAFADIERFVGQTLSIPYDFDITAPVLPTEVRVVVSPTGPALESVSVLVQTQEEWDAGLFVVQAIDVLCRVDDPLGDARVGVNVNGLFGIGANGTLEISAGAGTGGAVTLGGALRAGDDPLTIREVYQDLNGVTDATHLPDDLVVTHFDLFVELPAQGRPLTAHGLIELAGRWELIDGIHVDDVKFELRTAETTDFVASAEIVVSGVGLYITASYDTNEGWRFSGGTLPDQEIPIGALVADLATAFDGLALPAPISNVTLRDLAVSGATSPANITFAGAARFPIDDTTVDLTVSIDPAGGAFGGGIAATTPTGTRLEFTARFNHQAPESTRFAVTYTHDGGDLTVKELVAALTPSAARWLPDGLRVAIDDAVLAVESDTERRAYVFCVDLAATIDLAGLPVVGPRLTGDRVVGFDPLRVIAASAALPSTAVAEVNGLLPAELTPLPEQDLPYGFTLAGRLRLGPLETPTLLPVTVPAQPPASGDQQARVTDGTATTTDDVVWYQAQTSLGPIRVARVGLAYRHEPGAPARLAVLLDASVSVGGLTLSCDGLSATLPLTGPDARPTFDLAGLGLDYTGGPVRIGGAFLKDTIEYDGRTYPAYSGRAVIETGAFGAGALGSYVQLDEGPSLYVYAFLDYPIGGPAFFFVRGLAAGFGYNRRLVAPPVERVADFPLVAEAVGAQQPAGLADELRRLGDAVQVSPGDYFLAIGVHFTSFEMIDTFLLVTAGFGHRFELNVLGLSTLVLPAPDAAAAGVTPVAEIQVAVKATFSPDDGYFALFASLTSDSYLLSRSCRLTGGFALVTWFGDGAGGLPGDFVLTAGGYHPHFTVPAHYPRVPRLGFNWRVTPQLTMKGTAYYALTPAALMAGGELSAVYQDDSLRAWFDTSLDFIIAWQPYHYEAAFHLAVGASYTFSFFGTHTVTVHVGTDVQFWGPDFGGTATIDLDVVSFTIDFGSASGASAEPVPWQRFRAAQLPETVTTVAARSGVLRPGSGDDLGVLDPLRFELVTDSAIPCTRGEAGTTALGDGAPFGIAPVGLRDGFDSVQTITITRDGVSAEADFVFEPVGKNLPAAQWGFDRTPTLTGPALMTGLLTGYVIRPLPPDEPPPVTIPAPTPAALFTEADAFDWRPVRTYTAVADPFDPAQGADARLTIAGKLLPDAPIDLAGLTAADFLEPPQVVTADA